VHRHLPSSLKPGAAPDWPPPWWLPEGAFTLTIDRPDDIVGSSRSRFPGSFRLASAGARARSAECSAMRDMAVLGRIADGLVTGAPLDAMLEDRRP
jgi:hypothetical protein